MLDRARERVSRATAGRITTIQGDIREVELPDGEFDIVLAAAVLHHLRTDQEWRDVFTAFHRALRPGGSVWVFDLVESSIPAVQELMRRRYGEYLTRLKDEAYRDHVFAYVEKEDTPRPLLFQLDLLRQVGFAQVEVLHKNVCFAAFGAVKSVRLHQWSPCWAVKEKRAKRLDNKQTGLYTSGMGRTRELLLRPASASWKPPTGCSTRTASGQSASTGSSPRPRSPR